MGRKRTERQTQRDRERYANDPEYRERIKQQRRDYYQANKEKVKARAAAHRRNNPGRVWEAEILRKYGLTRERWDEMIVAQSGRCAICSEQMAGRVNVDHCHETGKVRGLLCKDCNTGLGHFRDSVERLRAAIDYLE